MSLYLLLSIAGPERLYRSIAVLARQKGRINLRLESAKSAVTYKQPLGVSAETSFERLRTARTGVFVRSFTMLYDCSFGAAAFILHSNTLQCNVLS